MSRNPYLAASRPSSSYTRSSRSSCRTGGLVGGSLLGRSRSSATLASHKPYSSSSLYVPQWQRSTSSTRSGSAAVSATGRQSDAQQASSYKPAEEPWQSTRSLGARPSGLHKSTSSSSLANQNESAEPSDDDQWATSVIIPLIILSSPHARAPRITFPPFPAPICGSN